ncbi:MAG: hypothetical protein HC828_13385 [Blastochloris sp.]|nr:hypothetical protein [Blastochloris sp.]
MPLPPEIDEQIRKRFEVLITEADKVTEEVEKGLSKIERWSGDRYARGPGPNIRGEEAAYFGLRTKVLNLLALLSIGQRSISRLQTEVEAMTNAGHIQQLKGVINGLKDVTTKPGCSMTYRT